MDIILLALVVGYVVYGVSTEITVGGGIFFGCVALAIGMYGGLRRMRRSCCRREEEGTREDNRV